MSDNTSSVKTRLRQLLKAKRVTSSEFARRLGVSSGYVGAMRKSLPEEKVVKISKIFPDLNRNWLLYGEGEMLKENDPEKALDGYLIPLLPLEAMAGSLQNFSMGISLEQCEFITSPVKGAELAIPISGDSMEPEIHNGTIAAICKINERAFIPWGNPMVVDTENGVLVKNLYPSELGEDYIEARSFNPRYNPFQIPKNSIFGIYRIVGYMRRVSTM